MSEAWEPETPAERSTRQRRVDMRGKPDRVEALVGDLRADLDFYQEERSSCTPR